MKDVFSRGSLSIITVELISLSSVASLIFFVRIGCKFRLLQVMSSNLKIVSFQGPVFNNIII